MLVWSVILIESCIATFTDILLRLQSYKEIDEQIIQFCLENDNRSEKLFNLI